MFKRLFIAALITTGCSAVSSGQIADCDFVGAVGCNIDDLNAIYAGTDGAPGLNARNVADWLSTASSPDNPLKADPAHVYLDGDINLDGSVDSTDLGELLNNFRRVGDLNWSDGNLTAGRSVNSGDLGRLLNNFGSTSAVAVPEPSGCGLALLLFLSLLTLRPKR